MGKISWPGTLALILLEATAGWSLELTATGHDSRIDLLWEGGYAGYHVHRSDHAAGPFERLTSAPWKLTVYSDFLGENDRMCHYRFTHYSFLGFDPRRKRDRVCNYFENNRNISLINRAYCAANPGGHKGYSEPCWGLTGSDTPGGYAAHEPRRDNGTITPSAAISAIPYVPEESLATLRHFYHSYGARLWGPFGFKDAFNLDKDWFAQSYLAIDQGPIVVMIENYRTGLCRRLFMANPEIRPMLERIGWTEE
ncbi:MAG: hypothetical protein JSW27_22405 [Phycisphaerales bacterium]|nr:MAG: hypothetical protein JSW27_22405 [Phycisphaerales bacterium]